MKYIQLKNSELFALVDEEDFSALNKFKWYLHNGYAVRHRSLNETLGPFRILMHRVILSPPAGKVIDHADGNGLNNTHDNIRICVQAENTKNVRRHRDNTSGYKGVEKTNPIGDKWSARICVNGKRIYLGSFKSKEEASAAYHKDFARLNT